MLKRVKIKHVGPITEADVQLGDLTILIGPQATGKSIFLQLLKLLIDRDYIHKTIESFSMSRKSRKEAFFLQYFGEGMESIWQAKSDIYLGRSSKPIDINLYCKRSRAKSAAPEQLFYMPAQRVMCLKDGLTRTYSDYRMSDPFIIKNFSQQIHEIMRDELDGMGDVFPKSNRLAKALREPLINHVFGEYRLRKDEIHDLDRLVLQNDTGSALPFAVWSAGQREFIPLLLGLYRLLPPAGVLRGEPPKVVVIEEPEKGLHPDAIGVVLNLLFEMLNRDHKVVITTYSPYILDVIWAIQIAQDEGARVEDVLRLLKLNKSAKTKELAASVLAANYRTHYFQRSGVVRDISSLDVDAEDEAVNGWGGLGGFSSHVSDVVATLVRP